MRMTARHAVRRRLMGSRTVSIEATSRARPFGSGTVRVLAGFGLVLLIATPLLLLPAASSGEQSATLLEALFTTISAVCVTGLVVVETQTQWSAFGEAIILVLIQVGGLGYMAGMGIVLWVLGRNLGLRDRNLMRLYYGAPSMREAASFARTIVIYSATFEILGALALFGGFVAAGVPVGRSVWWGIFHAVSAFNVAGFNITGADMTPFRDAPSVLIPMIVLCLGGSLGAVPVILGVLRLDPRRMSLDAKMVLARAAFTLAGGALFIGISEWGNTGTLAMVGASDRPLLAFFQASMWVSGFSAIDSGLLHAHTKLFEVGAHARGRGGGVARGRDQARDPRRAHRGYYRRPPRTRAGRRLRAEPAPDRHPPSGRDRLRLRRAPLRRDDSAAANHRGPLHRRALRDVLSSGDRGVGRQA